MTYTSTAITSESAPSFDLEGGVEREPGRIVEQAILTIEAVQKRVTAELGLEENSLAALEATDQALVHIAESQLDSDQASRLDQETAVDAAVIESALELDLGLGIEAPRTPVAALEFDGRGEDVEQSLARLNETHATLPGGHEVAPIMMAAIENLSRHPTMEQEGVVELSPPRSDVETQEDLLSVESFIAAAGQIEVINGTFDRKALEAMNRQLAQMRLSHIEKGDRAQTDEYALVKFLAQHETLLDAGILEASSQALSAWDKLLYTNLIERVAQHVAFQSYSGSGRPHTGFDSFEDLSPEEQAAAEVAAKRSGMLSEKAQELFASDESLSDLAYSSMQQDNFIRNYAEDAIDGRISTHDAYVYDLLLRHNPTQHADQTEMSSLADFAGKYAASSEVTRRVIENFATSYPRVDLELMFAINDQLTTAVDGLEGESQDQIIEQFLDFYEVRSGTLSLDEVIQIKKIFSDFDAKGVGVADQIKFFGRASSMLGIEQHADSEKSVELIGLLLSRGAPQGIHSELILQGLSIRPDDFEASLKHYSQMIDGIKQAGYPEKYIADQINSLFGPYFQNQLVLLNDGVEETIGEKYAHLFESKLVAMELVGPYGEQLNRLSTKDEPSIDGIADIIGVRYLQGERFDSPLLRERLESTTQQFAAFAAEHPDVHAAIIDRGIAVFSSPTDMLKQYDEAIHFGNKAAEYAPELAEHFQYPLNQIVGKLMVTTYDEQIGAHIVPDTVFESLDQYQTLRQSNVAAQFDRNRLYDIYVGNQSAESVAAFTQFLASETVEQRMMEKKGAGQINSALHNLYYSFGKYNFEKAYGLTDSVAVVPDEFLGEVVSAEAKLVSQGAKDIYYETAQTVLTRRDKNGNSYDNPRILGNMVRQYVDQDRSGQLRQHFDWFVGGDLPIAAMDSVTFFRQQAQVEQIEDTPKAVYEWIHRDPNKVTQLSDHYVGDYVDSILSERLGVSADPALRAEFIARARELAQSMQDKARLFINIMPQALELAMNSGGTLRSSFDTNGQRYDTDGLSTYNSSYMQRRSGVEIALGIRSLNEAEEHPIYGTIGFVDGGAPKGAYGYGDIMLTFRPTEALSASMSYTPEDSFHGAHRLTKDDAFAVRVMKSAVGQGSSKTKDYVEAQIVGGVSLDLVDAVYVASQETIDLLPQQLRSKAIVREMSNFSGADGSYLAVQEKALWQSISARHVKA